VGRSVARGTGLSWEVFGEQRARLVPQVQFHPGAYHLGGTPLPGMSASRRWNCAFSRT